MCDPLSAIAIGFVTLVVGSIVDKHTEESDSSDEPETHLIEIN